jgi:hypothetical protein
LNLELRLKSKFLLSVQGSRRPARWTKALVVPNRTV